MKIFSLSGFEKFPISVSDNVLVKQSVKVLRFNKNDTITHQGEVCSDIYFMRTGLVKLSYSTLEGKEFIKSFIRDGEMFGSLYSHLTGGGSTFSIVALEDIEVEVMPFSILQGLIEKYPALQQFALSFFQQLALKKEIREYEFLCLSAQERYEKFCQKNPEIVERIKQADLALYLGVTPIALSRMKHRQ